jgi:putative membrane protein
MVRHVSGLALLLGVAIGLAAAFQPGARVAAGGKDRDEALPLDRDFLTKAFVAGHKEIQLSKLADRHSRNDQVKAFAQQMIDDHTKANQQISELMKSQKLAVVAGTEKDFRDTSDRLGKLDGDAFDKEFVQVLVKDHKQAVALFENQAKSGKERDVTEFAKNTLPTIRGHLQHAQKLASSLGVK